MWERERERRDAIDIRTLIYIGLLNYKTDIGHWGVYILAYPLFERKFPQLTKSFDCHKINKTINPLLTNKTSTHNGGFFLSWGHVHHRTNTYPTHKIKGNRIGGSQTFIYTFISPSAPQNNF